MNGAEDTVLEEGHHVGLGGFLKGQEGSGLEPHVVGTHLDRGRVSLYQDTTLSNLTCWQISLITLEKGSLGMSKLVDF